MSAIIDLLVAEGREISQAVLAEQYRDPFWTARFGSKGRRHANEDSDFHLQYLTRALVTRDTGVLLRYARWLREVLNSRGMCSRHLAENFRLLAEGIEARGWPEGELAARYVREARAALAYEEGDAAAVERSQEAIVDAALQDAGSGRREALCQLVSYLADALAVGRPDTLVDHVRWTAGWLQRTGGDAGQLSRDLQALSRATLATGAPERAHEYLDAACAVAPTVEATP